MGVLRGGVSAGGSAALAELIEAHGGPIYADLLRFYRVDLVQVVAGTGPPPRLVLALIEQLPEHAATVAALRGGPSWRGWTHDRALLAGIYDAINANTAATGRWRRRPPRFPPWPRPKRRGAVTVAQIRRRFTGRG